MNKIKLKFTKKNIKSLPYTGIAMSKSKRIGQTIINKLCACADSHRGLMMKKEGDVLVATEGRMLLMLSTHLFPNQNIFGEHFKKGYALRGGIASEFPMPNYQSIMPKKSVLFNKIEPKQFQIKGKCLSESRGLIYEIWTNGEYDVPINKIYLDIFRKITLTLPEMFQEAKDKPAVMADIDMNIIGMIMPARLE